MAVTCVCPQGHISIDTDPKDDLATHIRQLGQLQNGQCPSHAQPDHLSVWIVQSKQANWQLHAALGFEYTCQHVRYQGTGVYI